MSRGGSDVQGHRNPWHAGERCPDRLCPWQSAARRGSVTPSTIAPSLGSRVARTLVSTTTALQLHSFHIYIPRSNPGLNKFLWPAGAPILVPPSRLLTPSRSEAFLHLDRLKCVTWLLAALRDCRKLSPSLGRVWPVVLSLRCQQLFVTSAPAGSFPGLTVQPCCKNSRKTPPPRQLWSYTVKVLTKVAKRVVWDRVRNTPNLPLRTKQ